MALIECPECGKKLSTEANRCPSCGCPIDAVYRKIHDNEVKNKLNSIKTRTLHYGYLKKSECLGFKIDDNTIETDLLKQAKNIQEIVIDEGVENIEQSLDNFKYVKVLKLPKTLKKICRDCFKGWESLQSIIIPNGVEEIGEDAFQGCSSLKKVTLPKNITKLCSGTFANCTSLESINLENIIEIGDNCFNDTGLREVILSSKLEYLGGGAFSDCLHLLKVYFPKPKVRQEINSSKYDVDSWEGSAVFDRLDLFRLGLTNKSLIIAFEDDKESPYLAYTWKIFSSEANDRYLDQTLDIKTGVSINEFKKLKNNRIIDTDELFVTGIPIPVEDPVEEPIKKRKKHTSAWKIVLIIIGVIIIASIVSFVFAGIFKLRIRI